MLEEGYILLYRSLLKWEWYLNQNTKDVFLHLLLTANYEQRFWEGITVERGQRVCSIATLSQELRLSQKSIRVALNHLKTTNEVAIKGANKYSVITLINYSKYQDLIETGASETASETANKGQTKGKQRANKGQHRKNVENVENDKNVKNTMFSEFWNIYPKKTAKPIAEKAFNKINPSEELFAIIKTAVIEQSKSIGWKKDGGQYIPYPATWLNSEQWNDEVRIQVETYEEKDYSDI